jgi:hypothetical protein
MAASPTQSLRSAWAFRPRRAGAGCGRWKRPASSRATTPRSTATRSAWACWPSCASTPTATPASHARLEEAIRKIPEVVACHYISGAGTFELQVVARDLDVFLAVRAQGADQPAERERPAHQLLAGRGEGQQRAAAGSSSSSTSSLPTVSFTLPPSSSSSTSQTRTFTWTSSTSAAAPSRWKKVAGIVVIVLIALYVLFGR